MRKRTVIVICRLDESLRDKVAAIKAESRGGITSVVEKAVKRYKLKEKK